MKKVLLMMLLFCGTVLTTSAQRGYDRGYRDHGRGHGHERYERGDRWDRCEPPRRVYVRDRYDCYRPQRVVYARPAYYPAYPAVIPVPVPVPAPRYYPPRPRAVFHAGVTIVN